MISLLYERKIKVNDQISVVIPTIGEIIEFGEEAYFGMVNILTSMPIDYMVTLDDFGIDFTQITDFDLFIFLFSSLKQNDTSLIFGDLSLANFQLMVDENEQPALVDPENDVVIDRKTYRKIATILRTIHNLEKNLRKPGNEEAKKYMLERARVKARRRKSIEEYSNLEPLIVSLVNTPEFKYNYESVKDLSIYQFNESVHKIVQIQEYGHLMLGVYTGNVDSKTIKEEDVNWLQKKRKKTRKE